ncbi:LysR family transcriptional regulator [Ralstonia sp. 25C]|uniref:LysR family transcriptional regulator n=1 Tax=Ralstonia sp. 25C TaxID=3447363 RepID=UPI003F750E40
MQEQFANSQALDDLNILRLIAAIHETGSLSGAAKRLGVNHATAFRRITAIEAQLGVRLFERQRGCYTATPAGEELAKAGAAIEDVALATLRRVAGQDLRPSGVVRIATTESFTNTLLPPILRICRATYPEIRLEVTCSNVMHDLSKGEADIAIRPAQRVPENLIGKMIASLAFAVYAASCYMEGRRGACLDTLDWIALETDQSQHRVLTRLGTIQPPERIAYVLSSFIGVRAACVSGLGLGVLPCFLGDSHPELERVVALPEDYYSQVWLLVHPDLYRVARVRAVFTVLHEALMKEAALLAGMCPRCTAPKSASPESSERC